MEIGQISRRIGLGGTDEFFQYGTVSDGIDAALQASVKFKGIPTIASEIESWPSHKEFDLDERIQRLIKRRLNFDSIDKQKLSDNERENAREKNWAKYSVDEIDKYRFFHAGQFADNQVN